MSTPGSWWRECCFFGWHSWVSGEAVKRKKLFHKQKGLRFHCDVVRENLRERCLT
jgi:hypothetical protein